MSKEIDTKEIISAMEAAGILRKSEKSLLDKRYRARLGLSVIRIGRRSYFSKSEIYSLIRVEAPGE